MRVSISRELLEQIAHLADCATVEVCGLLLGEEGRIEAIRPAANIAADPSRHFELDPAVLIAAHRAARTGGPRIVGHYHSHPSGVAVPSAIDAASAAPDGSLWLILADGAARLWIAGPGEGAAVHFTEGTLDIM
ncbi:proteasome lid subunit RPN8/RPN11 [Sphingobium wenxiniae]|uniref:Proteasome lid subunit RPN8/RPN11 n=1 Tax=Sphingobium wenxiniae (strain DSM 21828 / CGMCC 1.7748 / JZ-1) TaxID=595605 RepID=A0A562K8B0_SPHWJ|nr:M67 family metallopeptidase [Sphingobium wenxiniae]MBB6192492.1 proteasome lid subunit RPN8/RPN11 [Sphingobium wenxiniae]TWH91681.1 proteasome lid subunit RPN8/RPN11 [Sphingobium wenxiniae]